MRAVNLLPDDRGRESGGSSRYLSTNWVLGAGAALLAVVCVLVGFTYVSASNDVSNRQKTLESLQAEVQKAQALQVTPTAPSGGNTQAQLAAFNSAAAARIPWDTLLGDVARVLPSGSWLSSLNLQGGASSTDPSTGATTTAPTGFSVSGFALSHNIVAQVMQRLALVPMLSDITLQRSQRSDVGAHRAYAFTMSANVVVNGER